MRVLHVTTPAAVGGLEQVVHALATGHRDRGVETHVVAVLADTDSSADVHPFTARLARAGVVVHVLRPGARSYREERRQVADICRRVAPAVVHTHGYRADVLDASVARGAGIPTVSTAHGFTGGGWKNRLYEGLQTGAFRRFSAVVAVSEPLAERLRRRGVPEHVLHTVPNAWSPGDPPLPREEARAVLGASGARPLVGWVGRLSQEKGADVLIEALAALSDLDFSVAMIGAGPERARLEKRAGALGVSGRVRWHGALPGASRLFAALDVFVLSSRTEGTPIALLEAMAAGVPIVATAVGGVPRMLATDEATLVPAEHAPSLARALRAALADPAAAAVRAARARRRLERDFIADDWLARYEHLYELVSRPRTLAVTR